ncbi:hypothetical protein ACFL6C_09590 [Myxococcota bacterium]
MGALIALCVLMMGVSVLETPEAQARNRFLVRAKKAYDDLDYTRVIPFLKRALKAAKTDEEHVEIYFLFATMHAIYSRDEQARDAFKELLARNPDFELPPDISPKIRAAFELAKGEMPASEEEPPPEPIDEEQEELEAVPIDDGLPEGPSEEDNGINATDPLMNNLIQRRRSEPVYKKWWFWTIIGVAAAAGGSALGFALLQPDTPDHDLGPVPLQ